MARKTGLTLEQHQQLGLDLETARLLLLRAYVTLGRAYPLATKQVRATEVAEKAIRRVKLVMDDVACEQFPESSGVQATHLYYGRGKEVDAAAAAKK